ncbi:MAG: hypothetical protein OXF02_07160 [Simkaniaceae bacterium]|nr:hypothetical protein [Simkaniaceae bacterium]
MIRKIQLFIKEKEKSLYGQGEIDLSRVREEVRSILSEITLPSALLLESPPFLPPEEYEQLLDTVIRAMEGEGKTHLIVKPGESTVRRAMIKIRQAGKRGVDKLLVTLPSHNDLSEEGARKYRKKMEAISPIPLLWGPIQ